MDPKDWGRTEPTEGDRKRWRRGRTFRRRDADPLEPPGLIAVDHAADAPAFEEVVEGGAGRERRLETELLA